MCPPPPKIMRSNETYPFPQHRTFSAEGKPGRKHIWEPDTRRDVKLILSVLGDFSSSGCKTRLSVQTQPCPYQHTMENYKQSPTKQLISRNAYIVWIRWPASVVLSLTSRKGNDKYFLEHCCHFRCRKSLYTEPPPQMNKCGRLLLLPCSSDSRPRTRNFFFLHRNLVHRRGRHRGKGHTTARLAKLYDAATYILTAEVFCWAAIFSVKFSFLFYFRALVNKLYKMEVWCWITFAVLVPTSAISIAGPFILCPRIGSSKQSMPDLLSYRIPYS